MKPLLEHLDGTPKPNTKLVPELSTDAPLTIPTMSPKNLDKYHFVYDEEHGLLLRTDEKFSMYMNPLIYLQQNHRYLDANEVEGRVANQLQLNLHIMLERYLNSFPVPAIPLKLKTTRRLTQRMQGILWYLQKLKEIRPTPAVGSIIKSYRASLSARILRSKELADLISASYKFLSKYLKQRNHALGTPQSIAVGRAFSHDLYTQNSYLPLTHLRKAVNGELRNYLRDCLLHGSYSTLDHCGYSDLDTLVILRKNVVQDGAALHQCQKLLRRTLKYLYMVDCLQHHGHSVLAEQDLDCFPEIFFPITLFHHSTSLMHNGHSQKLTIQMRNSDLEACNEIWNICYSFRESYLMGALPRNSYEFKLYLSKLMLLPALFLQMEGTSCYKKDSFELAREHFSAADWTIVDEATQIRAAWRNPLAVEYPMKRALDLGFNPVLASVGVNLLNRRLPQRLRTLATLRFYKKATTFSESIMTKLLERNAQNNV